VELSIVLVIIGLILGGVMVGRSMIRSMQVNAVAQDWQAYESATQTFIDKYQGLPGDITNASTFWGAAVANGNGNGQLNVASASGAAGEIFGAWEQMALAGMIKGVYSGLSGSGSTHDAVIGSNVPAGRLSGTGFSWYYYGALSGSPYNYDGFYGNHVYFGSKVATAETQGNVLTPAEAFQIDQKIDDGIPATGVVRSFHAVYNPNCVTGAAAAGSTASYNTATYTGVACGLIFVPGI
jgi:hypothetical protein